MTATIIYTFFNQERIKAFRHHVCNSPKYTLPHIKLLQEVGKSFLLCKIKMKIAFRFFNLVLLPDLLCWEHDVVKKASVTSGSQEKAHVLYIILFSSMDTF